MSGIDVRGLLGTVGFGQVPFYERALTTACFILLVGWLICRFIVHITETTWKKIVQTSIEAPVNADVVGRTDSQISMHVRANRAADVLRTCFFLLFTVFVLMSLADIATLLLVSGRDLEVIAWVFTGLALCWAGAVMITNHPVVGGVFGFIEYSLIIACWSIIVNRANKYTYDD